MIEFVKSKHRIDRPTFRVQIAIVFGFLLFTLLVPMNCKTALAESPELKPVLKAIDPSTAKLDIAPKPKPEETKSPKPPAPNYKYTPYKSSNPQGNAPRVAPARPPSSGSYGMGAAPSRPYVPSTNPNNRYNQVFTPPWQQNRAPASGGYQARPNQNYNQNPGQNWGANQSYRPPPQQYPGAYQYNQGYQQNPAYRPNQAYQRQPYPNQPYQAPPRQYYPPQNNQYPQRQGYNQRQQYPNPGQRQSYPPPNQGYRTPQSKPRQNSGFPSSDLIPEFGKPLPMNASNKGLGGRWTSGANPNQFKNQGPESRVSKLEQTAFGSTYPEHDVEARLDHLEKEIFGSKSSGTVNERLSRLEYKLGGKGVFNSGYSGSSSKKDSSKKVAQAKSNEKEQESDIGTNVSATESSQLLSIIDKIPYKRGAGDYFERIRKFPGNTVARWTDFPVKVRFPENTPSVWSQSINNAISAWNKYIPIKTASREESAQIEIAWINHLPPKLLGVTRLTAYNGKLKVKIFLLRPTYYVPSLNEKALEAVIVHELGHSLGLFGHSTKPKDTMFVMQLDAVNGKLTHNNVKKIGVRDLNTLRRVYQSPALPAKFSTTKPLEWSIIYKPNCS